jgi:hypothetical protein
VQVRARRALWALNEASTSEVISWAYPQLMWGDRNRNHYNRAARRALQSIGAIRIGRAPTTGRPWLWRLKTPPSIMFAGGLIRVRFRTGSLSPCCRIWLLETVKNSNRTNHFLNCMKAKGYAGRVQPRCREISQRYLWGDF